MDYPEGSNTEEEFSQLQNKLIPKIKLQNAFLLSEINFISGVDLAYWKSGSQEFAVCCILTIDYKTKKIVEIKHYWDRVQVPYIAGYLSFRELPIILETYKLLDVPPDLVIFDGNGYLHYRHMGIATHASFYLNKPTIGVAKSYLKIENVDYVMPENQAGSYTDIIVNGEIYGRVLRTHKNVKPIFVSAGNWIDLDASTKIVLDLVDQNSRQPIPIRLADIETKKMRRILCPKGGKTPNKDSITFPVEAPLEAEKP